MTEDAACCPFLGYRCQVYTKTLVRVYLNPIQASSASTFEESGNYEAFVAMLGLRESVNNVNGFFIISFLQKLNWMKTVWDQARFSSLV